MVSPKAFKNVTKIPTSPVGAGPFKLTSYVPDSHADLVRNAGYWDADQIHVANFTVQDITDPSQILAALQSGQVNVAYIAGNQVATTDPLGHTTTFVDDAARHLAETDYADGTKTLSTYGAFGQLISERRMSRISTGLVMVSAMSCRAARTFGQPSYSSIDTISALCPLLTRPNSVPPMAEICAIAASCFCLIAAR